MSVTASIAPKSHLGRCALEKLSYRALTLSYRSSVQKVTPLIRYARPLAAREKPATATSSFAVWLQQDDPVPTRVVSLNAPWIQVLQHVKALPFVPRRTVVFEDVPLAIPSLAKAKKKLLCTSKTSNDITFQMTTQTKKKNVSSKKNCLGLRPLLLIGRNGSNNVVHETNESINQSTPFFSSLNSEEVIRWIQVRASQKKQNKDLCLALNANVGTRLMRQAVAEHLRKAVSPCGNATKVLVFPDPMSNKIAENEVYKNEPVPVAKGVAFVECTTSEATARLLAPECQLFGVVWPDGQAGHLIYPQSPRTYRSVIIQQRCATQAHDRPDEPLREPSQQIGILKAALVALQRVLRVTVQRRGLQFCSLMHPINVHIRRLDRKRCWKMMKIRRVRITSNEYQHAVPYKAAYLRGGRTPSESSKRVNNRYHERLGGVNLVPTNSKLYQYGSAYTDRATLVTVASSPGGYPEGRHHQRSLTHAVQQPHTASRCPASVSRNRAKPYLSSNFAVSQTPLLDHQCHPSQLVLRFHSFRIAYAVLMILKTCPVFKTFNLGLISDRRIVSCSRRTMRIQA